MVATTRVSYTRGIIELNRFARPRLIALGLAVALAVIGVALFASTISLSFFWEDPFDIGQVSGRSFVDFFFTPNSNSYYRPLTLATLKLIRDGPLGVDARAYHASVVIAHIAASLLLFGFARDLFRRTLPAFASALIFLVFAPGYEAVARASSPHPWVAALVLAAMWLYLRWRARGKRALMFVSVALASAAMLVQESAVLVCGFVPALEFFLWRQRRVARFHPLALMYALPAAAFSVVWLAIPKPIGEALEVTPTPEKFAFVSQGFSFPLAHAAARLGHGDAQSQALAAFVLSLIVLLVGYGRRWRMLALFVVWWLMGVSLAWLARSMAYLEVSPRVLYFPAFAAALAWGGLLDVNVAARTTRERASLIARALVVVAVITNSVWTLSESISLYRAGSEAMSQLVALGATGGRQLFVNVPDRFAHQQRPYPLGYWGMLLAPVSQELSDFVRFASGVDMETRSLTARPLVDAAMAASPYVVNTRGVEAYASQRLYDDATWADQTVWADYAPDGEITLSSVGDIARGAPAASRLGVLGDVAAIESATALPRADGVEVSIALAALGGAKPNDTLFVQLLDERGVLVAQQDGDALGGLIALSAWRAGDTILDRRVLRFNAAPKPGEYRVIAGLYSRDSGRRAPARSASGARAPDDAIEVARVRLP